jgi:hypothetical protein
VVRFLVASFLLWHGVAHVVGFRAAFWAPSEATLGWGQLGGHVLGVIWLLLALGYAASAGLLVWQSSHWSNVALVVTLGSALLCGSFLPDARIGLFVDLALLAALLLVSRSSSAHLAAAFARELRDAKLPAATRPGQIVDEAAILGLPESVRHYFRFMGALGRPRDWSFRARFDARFRLDAGRWLRCEVLQYDTRLELSRVFYMQLSLKGFLPVTVRDTYLAGRGKMQAKAFDAVRVASGVGYELDVGELVTYLNDAILFAPSLLLGPETSWREVDASAFDVTLRDGELSVTARVSLDERGAPLDFSTTDRFFEGHDGKRVRTEWRTPVSGWQDVGGRKVPKAAQAVWQLPAGAFAYADFVIDPGQIAFNVPPS